MKKACIITLNGNTNLGNRLQNYALQEYLKRYNLECDTLWYENKSNIINKIIKFIKNFIIMTTAPFYKKNKERLLKKKREKCIADFTKQNISCVSASKDNLEKIEDDYDVFVFGSDQIWHPYAIEHDELVCGNFIKHTKKVSYAASLAVNKIDELCSKKLRNSLLSFDKITVREEKGKEILEKILPEKKVDVVIDPTMLLTTEEWEKISKKPEKLKDEKYILTYFLGEISENRKIEIERIAKKNNCKIINVLDKKSDFYVINPREFLYLEENAFLICTDSFHSCVFAILFNRPFIVFKREDNNEDMSSRLENLIKKFELKNRLFTNKINDENLQCDYTIANEILERERSKSEELIERIIEK